MISITPRSPQNETAVCLALRLGLQNRCSLTDGGARVTFIEVRVQAVRLSFDRWTLFGRTSGSRMFVTKHGYFPLPKAPWQTNADCSSAAGRASEFEN